MRTLPLILLTTLSFHILHGQQVTGMVRDDQGKPLASASIALKKAADSSVVKLSISDPNGQYAFVPVTPGRYFIRVSHIGFQPGRSNDFETGQEGDFPVQAIRLVPLSGQLTQAIVQAAKPLVEVKPDRIILNVEGNINAIGSNALELLQKSPGVTMDKDNNLNLAGVSGVQVYIDGRPTHLSGTALSGYLQTLSSSLVESIEIIAHPSAHYEAAGSAGIVNIRLKKNNAYGTNMTMSAGYNVGVYGKYNGSVSLNHREAHLNVYGDYTYNYAINESLAKMYRELADTAFNQQSTLVTKAGTHSYRAGMDWFVDNRNTLGLVVNGSSTLYTLQTFSSTPIVYIPADRTEKLLVANNHTDETRDNVNADLNYRYADSSSRELNVAIDYGTYHLRSNQLQPNDYYDPTGQSLLYSNVYNIVSPTDIRICSGRADYSANFANGRLSLGWKSSLVTTSNIFQENDVYTWGSQRDSLSSNVFNYRENIHAVYADYKRTGNGWIVQGGIRVENTYSKGTSTGYQEPKRFIPPLGSPPHYIPYDSSFTRNYTDLFPNISVTWNRDPVRQWTLSYSRRLDRPAYQDLNPFEFKIDDYTFYRGNTKLLPQYTNTVGLSWVYAHSLSASLNYSHTSDMFTVLADTTGVSKLIDERENLSGQDVASMTLSYPLTLKWYSVFASVTGAWLMNKADFGPGRQIDLNVVNMTVYSQHTFRLGHGWTGQLTQYYASPTIWQATLRSRSLWSLDAGLQKSIMGGNGSFRISVSDIFHTLDWSATSDFAGQYILNSGRYESRQLKLYFSCRFGNKQLKAARHHSNGDEEETRRVGSGAP
jgi:outer membrane receptor protein involved in Fe transport